MTSSERRIADGRTTLWSIQYLRGIAALAVVFHHSSDFIPMFAWIRSGATGVDVFFVISGFIMAYTRSSHAESGESRALTATYFLAKRAIRIIPLYWLATAVAWRAELLHGAFSMDMWKDFLFVPHVYSDQDSNLWPKLIPGWTINCEVFFYWLLGLAIVVSKRPLRSVLVILSLLCAIGLLFTPVNAIGRFYTASILMEFCFGIVVYEAYRRWPKQQTPLVRRLIAGLAAGALVAVSLSVPFELSPQRFYEVGIAAALLVWAALQDRRAAYHPALGLLGDASYSIYLFHLTVGFELSRRLMKVIDLTASSAAACTLMLIIFVGVSAMIGIVVHLTVERPMTNALKRWTRRRLLTDVRADTKTAVSRS